MVGIYKITNIKNDKVYVGSSKDIEKRWNQHVNSLKNNTHHSSKLQRSYNKTKDKSIFQFEVIEETTEDELKKREQYYIDLYDSFNSGYNCSAEVDNLKYTEKYVSELNKKRIVKHEYDKFFSAYEQYKDSFVLGKVFEKRIEERRYTDAIKTINKIMNWFMENYDVREYKCRSIVCNNKQYYIVVGDKDDNEFACYKWYKDKMYNSPYDTQIFRNYLKDKLDEKKHYLIDVPDFDFNKSII